MRTNITRQRIEHMITRWSFLLALIISTIWIIRWFITGELSVAREIHVSASLDVQLPIEIPRICDVLLILVYVYLIRKIQDTEGVILGFIVGTLTTIIFMLPIELGISLIGGLGTGLALLLADDLPLGVCVWLTVGLIAGLFNGLLLGLSVDLAAGLILCLGWVLTHLKSIHYQHMTIGQSTRYLANNTGTGNNKVTTQKLSKYTEE